MADVHKQQLYVFSLSVCDVLLAVLVQKPDAAQSFPLVFH
jgi:hypothetical protein